MSEIKNQWLESILYENAQFKTRISPANLPMRTPGALGVITCMDPRVNLAAIGIPGFTEEGESYSAVRIIRTIGAMAEPRSLAIGIFLAGIREFVVLMHTDCGCCMAFSKIDTIIERMKTGLSPGQFRAFRDTIGEPFQERLIAWLKAFEEPRAAIRNEITSIKAFSFVPNDVIFHGLLYDVTSGHVEVVINGYE